MSRVCEICGRSEAVDEEETETSQVISALEPLIVCADCRQERRPQAERSL